jgi:hypothetical protein
VSGEFSSARHSSSPQLRQRKARSLSRDPLARGISQGDVWDGVHAKLVEMGVRSPTSASSDAYEQLREPLDALEAAFPRHPGQTGAVLVLGEDLCLDYVSRPDVFERLYPKLLRGYMLDALGRLDRQPAGAKAIAAFVHDVSSATRTKRPSAGLGEDLRLEGPGMIGSGLELDGELLQLSAFSSEREQRTFGRISRPSRRRA